jgi:hypothetical protein
MIAWCENQTNKMENRYTLEEVSRVLRDLETKERVKVRGILAISILRKMGLWDDYVLSARGILRIEKEGSYCNGDRIMFVNRAGNRPLYQLKFGRVVFSVLCYQLTKFLYLEKKMNRLLLQHVTTKKVQWQIEWYTALDLGLHSDLEISHRGHVSKCINAKTCDPETSLANKRRNRHTFCNCDCEIFGLDRCINPCGDECDICHEENNKDVDDNGSQDLLEESTDWFFFTESYEI